MNPETDPYRAGGITLRHRDGDWRGSLAFYDTEGWKGFPGLDVAGYSEISTQGVLWTSNWVSSTAEGSALSAVVDALRTEADRMGIILGDPPRWLPRLKYEGDGESREWPPPPDWKEQLATEAARIGWESLYE